MNRILLGSFCLVAALATGCHSSPTPGDPATAAPAAPSARAQALRLHDAAMNRMDAVMAEQQRLQVALTAQPASPRRARLQRALTALGRADEQMMTWMHTQQEPDSTTQPRARVEAYWQQQLPVLRRLDQQATIALDSARALR